MRACRLASSRRSLPQQGPGAGVGQGLRKPRLAARARAQASVGRRGAPTKGSTAAPRHTPAHPPVYPLLGSTRRRRMVSSGWVSAVAVMPAQAPAMSRRGTDSSPSCGRGGAGQAAPSCLSRPLPPLTAAPAAAEALSAFCPLACQPPRSPSRPARLGGQQALVQVVGHELPRRVGEDAQDLHAVALPEGAHALLPARRPRPQGNFCRCCMSTAAAGAPVRALKQKAPHGPRPHPRLPAWNASPPGCGLTPEYLAHGLPNPRVGGGRRARARHRLQSAPVQQRQGGDRWGCKHASSCSGGKHQPWGPAPGPGTAASLGRAAPWPSAPPPPPPRPPKTSCGTGQKPR